MSFLSTMFGAPASPLERFFSKTITIEGKEMTYRHFLEHYIKERLAHAASVTHTIGSEIYKENRIKETAKQEHDEDGAEQEPNKESARPFFDKSEEALRLRRAIVEGMENVLYLQDVRSIRPYGESLSDSVKSSFAEHFEYALEHLEQWFIAQSNDKDEIKARLDNDPAWKKDPAWEDQRKVPEEQKNPAWKDKITAQSAELFDAARQVGIMAKDYRTMLKEMQNRPATRREALEEALPNLLSEHRSAGRLQEAHNVATVENNRRRRKNSGRDDL